MTPLLLHACCGPCSLEPVRALMDEGYEPTICWTNPNIAPVEEHDKRLSVLLDWAEHVAHLPVIIAVRPGNDCRHLHAAPAPLRPVYSADSLMPGVLAMILYARRSVTI